MKNEERKNKNSKYFNQSVDKLKLNTSFNKDVEKIRKKYNLDFSKKRTRLYFGIPEKIYNEAFELLKKYNLPIHYEDTIANIIIKNDLGFVYSSSSDKIKIFTGDKLSEEKSLDNRLFLEVFSDTTTKDLQGEWINIKKEIKKLPGYKDGRRKLAPNHSRDKEIVRLHQQGKTDSEIKKIINKNIEDKNKMIYGYDTIPKIILRFNKKNEKH